MSTRVLAMLVVTALWGCGGYSPEQIEAGRVRTRVFAACLDDVAEGVGTGSFDPKYAGCVTDILGWNDGDGFRELQAAGLRVPVMALMAEREPTFQDHIDEAATATDADTQQRALLSYQLLLGAAATDLRELAE